MFDLGDQIAGYRLTRVLGRGGMGIVYEATQLSLNRSVALKVIAPGISSDSAFRERFRREGPLQARIDHPHIVSVFEAGDWEGHLFLAMRLVRGPSLRELVREGALAPDRALRILTPVADALDTAHEESLIHRDVKPHNILVGRGDHAFLADFGLMKSIGEQSLTKTGHFVGTLDYIAPEQVQGEDASRASDIYALAAVLYETLTGSPPFSRATDAATLYAHVADPPPRPSETRADLGAQIDEVIAHGLAKAPSERPRTALALMDEAERALRARSGRERSVVPPAPAPRSDKRKDATTDVLAEPDLTARPTPESDEEPLRPAPGPAQPVTPLPAPATTLREPAAPVPPTTLREPAPPEPPTTLREPAPPAPLRPAAFAPTVADTRPKPVAEPDKPDEPVRPPRPASTARPAQPQSQATRRGRAVVSVLAAALVACGFVVGSSGGEEPAPSSSVRPVSTPALTLSVPAAWSRRNPVPTIDGLELADAVGYGPSTQQAAVLLAGVARDGAGPTLLAPAFRTRLPAAPSRDDRVVLADRLQAQRYAALRPRGAETPLTLLVIPTSAGVLTVACREGGAGAAFVAECLRAARSLRLRGAQSFALGPDEAYGKQLTATLDRLERQRSTALAQLRGAKSRTGQARRASAVASAYSSAARSLATVPANPLVREHNAAIRTALRAQGGRYRELGRAARRGRPKTYSRTVAAIGKGKTAISKAIAALRDLGYER